MRWDVVAGNVPVPGAELTGYPRIWVPGRARAAYRPLTRANAAA